MEDLKMARAGRLEGAVAVVTGSSSGNGRWIAIELAREGAKVVCSDLSKSLHPNAVDTDEYPDLDTDELIRKFGGEADYKQVDVGDEPQVDSLADFAVKRYGRLDTWVNNAGVGVAAPLADYTVEDYDVAHRVNVIGTFLGIKAAVRVMRQRERDGRSLGRIINIGSVAGEVGQGLLAGYSSSKGAVHALTRELAIELAPEFINVNAIAPGYFVGTALNKGIRDDPELTALVEAKHAWPEMAPSRDLGRAAVFLASDDAAWITGVILPVDGGLLVKR
jgi:NAD(P)-dependent dehydrogenase (short-subunit alcohol dehydrogenase family)